MTKQKLVKKLVRNGIVPVTRVTLLLVLISTVTGCAIRTNEHDIKTERFNRSNRQVKHNCIGKKLERCLQLIKVPYTRTDEGEKVIIYAEGEKTLKKGSSIHVNSVELPLSVSTEKEKVVFIAVDGIVRHSYRTIQHTRYKGIYIHMFWRGVPFFIPEQDNCELWGRVTSSSCYFLKDESHQFYELRNLSVGQPFSEFTEQTPIKVTDNGTTLKYSYKHFAHEDCWFFRVDKDTGLIVKVYFRNDCPDESENVIDTSSL